MLSSFLIAMIIIPRGCSVTTIGTIFRTRWLRALAIIQSALVSIHFVSTTVITITDSTIKFSWKKQLEEKQLLTLC